MAMTNRPALLVLFLVAIINAGCHRRVKPTPSEDVDQGRQTSKTNASSSLAPRADNTKWRSDTCDEPCCGGTACRVTPDNSDHAACRGGQANCNKCASGLTCIPGTCTALLPRGETWELHVSYVSGGNTTDVCQSTWSSAFVCLRIAGGVDWACLPLSDSCSHDGHGEASVSVSTEDLTSRGLDIEVRSGSEQGSVVASRSGARYAGGIMTRALCTGLKFDHLTSAKGVDIDSVAFFLEPPR